MESTYKLVKDEESFNAFRAQLRDSRLPADDIDFKKDLLVGYYEGDTLIGTGALEIYGKYALLRSLSVKFGIRGKSIGSSITEYLVELGRKKDLQAIYLLTETAHDFFVKRGFVDITREQVPDPVKLSSEFSHVCPASAAVMELQLK